jgi:hypothetical protein
MNVPNRQGLIRVWQTDGERCQYPEHYLVGAGPLTGVCFSGGSTRAYAAAIGQLRALTELGLIRRIHYISAVSGGAWAAVAYTFYAGSGESDLEILGKVETPSTLSIENLDQINSDALGYAATLDFSRVLWTTHQDSSIPVSDVWSHAIGRMFLEPFGLFDSKCRTGFTLDTETYQEFCRRNPSEHRPEPHRVRAVAARPYLLVHATLNWPVESQGHSALVNRIGFEFSALAAGSPHLLTLLSEGGESHRVGGGFVEVGGGGCLAPSTKRDNQGLVSVSCPGLPLTLADVVGASSAFRSKEKEQHYYPRIMHWPVSERTDEVASTEVLSDGGDVENYGLIALLRRRVTSIVVFVNTLWPLSLDYDPSIWSAIRNDGYHPVDPFLAPLFGQPNRRFPHNQVFAEREFSGVVGALQAAKRAGRALVTTQLHAVQTNDWWGLEGGWEVQICWVYNDRVPEWEAQLSPALCAMIEEGHGPFPKGPVARFPHYLTRGQNTGSLIRLSQVQINLLSHLASWTVTANASTFAKLFC